MSSCIHVLVAMLVIAPLGAKAADLVVWWEQGYNPEENAAVRETIAAFEQGSGKQVELVFYDQWELPERLKPALNAGQPPDFAFGTSIALRITEWTPGEQLVNLTDAVGFFSDMFDQDALAVWTLLDPKTEQLRLYALPMGRTTNHIHVWKGLLERAGFTLADIPKEWEAFWSFWCDQVQPSVRRATGRSDIWGVGLNMSGAAADTQRQFFQFRAAYDVDYVTNDRRFVIDDPEVRRRLIGAIAAYTAVYRKGCTPPDSLTWDDAGNNQVFLAETVVMTANGSLSIPNALKVERPDDYYRNTATVEWPLGPDGEAFPIMGTSWGAVVFKDGRNVGAAKEFVRFLVAEGWLAHYLDFAGERFLPPMQKLREGPLWLDPSDPHRMAAVMQIASRPTQYQRGYSNQA